MNNFNQFVFEGFRKESLSAVNSFFRTLASNLTPGPPPPSCYPRCRGEKVSFQTFFDNPPGQEAYHALKISRVDLPLSLGHSQSISRHPRSFGDVLYRIPILYFWFVRGLGFLFRHFDLLRLSIIHRVLPERSRLFSIWMTIYNRNFHDRARLSTCYFLDGIFNFVASDLFRNVPMGLKIHGFTLPRIEDFYQQFMGSFLATPVEKVFHRNDLREVHTVIEEGIP